MSELTCPVLEEDGTTCGRPAREYPMPLGVKHTACPKHRLLFLALLGTPAVVQAVSLAPCECACHGSRGTVARCTHCRLIGFGDQP